MLWTEAIGKSLMILVGLSRVHESAKVGLDLK